MKGRSSFADAEKTKTTRAGGVEKFGWAAYPSYQVPVRERRVPFLLVKFHFQYIIKYSFVNGQNQFRSILLIPLNFYQSARFARLG